MAIFLFLFANLGTAIAVNRWNKFFFDALEQKNADTVVVGLGLVLLLAVLSAAFSVGLLRARMRLQVRWRQWLTRTLIGRWLTDRHFYQLTIVHTEAANPEARIAEDSRLAIELLVDFSAGRSQRIVGCDLLHWHPLGRGRISDFGRLFYPRIHGVAHASSIAPSRRLACSCSAGLWCVTSRKRRPVRRDLRYELTRVKDNAENIAMIGGDEEERGRLDATFSDLVRRWFGVILWQGRMMWLNGANLVLAPVVPLLLGAPKYLAGEMTLGSLMQAATAFVQVQTALNWLADNAPRLADWFASSHRVTQLSDAIDRLQASLGPIGQGETIKLGASPDDRVYLRQLNIALYDGRLMIDGAEAVIAPGEKVLVKGTPEQGKAHSFGRWLACGRGEAARYSDPRALT